MIIPQEFVDLLDKGRTTLLSKEEAEQIVALSMLIGPINGFAVDYVWWQEFDRKQNRISVFLSTKEGFYLRPFPYEAASMAIDYTNFLAEVKSRAPKEG